MNYHFQFLRFFISCFILIIIYCFPSYSQAGTYYDLINNSSASFVSDLQNRIRSPYTQVSYSQFDETNIANFAAIDNGDGTKSVFGVYTNFEHIYTGTFTWLPLSREHTYASSWQPTNPSTSGPEYSDQYNLFPVHQNRANAVRSNHPLGIVANVTSSFLEGKYGSNLNGDPVYEPRDKHKGDAARALFYMALRYDGVNGNDWDFNWLNNTRLPSLSEAAQDLTTLINWHKQDPPDKWEVDRNNYIQSVQNNRNPFVDHPEYLNFINMNDLSKLTPSYSTEPTNYITNFSSSATQNDITVTWTDAVAGSQVPSDYLLLVYSYDNYFLPINGETYSDDTDLSDSVAIVNISYSGSNSYIFSTNLSNNTTYYFSMFSYNGSGTSANYKIDGTFPNSSVLFEGTLAIEPTNHVTNFASGTITSSSIQLTWTDALAKLLVPETYLIKANTTGAFSAPVDGVVYSDDTNLADGSAQVNILYSSADNYTFSSLNSSTTYYFKIYPYNGSSNERNYKTDGIVPSVTAPTSSAGGGGSFSELLISEYVEGSSNNKAIEIYNGTASTVDLSADGYSIAMYFNGNISPATTVNLTGSVASGDVYVVAHSSASPFILAVTNYSNSSSWFNGDDAVVLLKGINVIDAIGQIGFDPGSQWGSGLTSTKDNTLRRQGSVTGGDTNPNDAFDPSIEWVGYVVDTFDGLGNPDPLPVELTSFTASVNNFSVLLEWSTATEVNNFGFEIQRKSGFSTSGDDWIIISFAKGYGSSNLPKYYSYADENLQPGNYLYRLKQIDNDGSYEYSEIIQVEIKSPDEFILYQNYPNPFNPSTKIKYQIPGISFVTIKIYDVLGSEVAALVNEEKPAGHYEIEFDGTNLPSGIYFYQFRDGSFVQTKKMLMIK